MIRALANDISSPHSSIIDTPFSQMDCVDVCVCVPCQCTSSVESFDLVSHELASRMRFPAEQQHGGHSATLPLRETKKKERKEKGKKNRKSNQMPVMGFIKEGQVVCHGWPPVACVSLRSVQKQLGINSTNKLVTLHMKVTQSNPIRG